ncbi:MAG: bifunctional UDP-N-acetylglucosamine diphosphorylase/glucosamine-1-phosphate N-acetyltransferase GlmU [Alphaproteobacteria bacterium]|nr:bifunctional UDP-N-acetylglucosamine diphosphorylase/glucosamine-1-phosphate N-acetyltransferase GlmU [Alphaproteobacteria bacterium]MDD9919472.1 bifunctional UDP-N-acetylglucosamine diphosphorylase/glucosamine-1-phosphate N-acetyltransferase GlmU [Alphaproteobacteria bacterium]
MNTSIAVIILAAGKGTRMKSSLPKVLHPLANRPMILHILDTVEHLNPEHTVVITGHEADAVETEIHKDYPNAVCIRQTEQLGTGHAVLQAKEALEDFNGTTLILNGDVPLIKSQALADFIGKHRSSSRTVTMASTLVADPTGLGRIIRNDDGAFITNKEHKDCSPEEHDISEVNVGLYAVDNQHLFNLLSKISNDNIQQEYYLPDIAAIGLADGLTVDADFFDQPPEELGGINDRLQLAEAEMFLQDRYRTMHMLNGVTLQDPATTYFSWDTQLGKDITIGQQVVFGPRVTVKDETTILPFSHLEGCSVGTSCRVGPFARLRPEAILQERARVGNFSEIKKATLGKASKVNHLSYVGDATIGDDCNIGAGTVFANYDHHKKRKHHADVGHNVAIGANSVIVAPASVGDHVKIGAGTVIRKDVEGDMLVVDKTEQVNKSIKS